MKKTYSTPSIQTIKLNATIPFLAGSVGFGGDTFNGTNGGALAPEYIELLLDEEEEEEENKRVRKLRH